MAKIRHKEQFDNSNTLNLFSDRSVFNTNTSLVRAVLHETVTDSIPICACCGKSKDTHDNTEANFKAYKADLVADRDRVIHKPAKPKNKLKVTLKGSGTSPRSKNEFLGDLGENEPENQAVAEKPELTPAQAKARTLEFKKAKAERKDFIGKKIKSVGNCGIRAIEKQPYYNVVQGEKGSFYYQNMQKCGSIWFCEDCGFKLLQERSDKVRKQLKRYRKAGKTVFFITFTLQHSITDRLKDSLDLLQSAFNFANTQYEWKEAKAKVSARFLWVLEVLYGKNGHHPHRHCLFIGDADVINAINVFAKLYKRYLAKRGLLINEHTVDIREWNGDIDSMDEYMFKGQLARELLGGSFKKDNRGKTFYELVDEQVKKEQKRERANEKIEAKKTNEQREAEMLIEAAKDEEQRKAEQAERTELQHKEHRIIDEYIKVMKGCKQWHKSDNFFDPDIEIKSDEEVLKDDTVKEIIYTIPFDVFADIRYKKIARRLLIEHWDGGRDSVLALLELYDVNTDFIVHNFNLRYQSKKDWIAKSTVKYAYVGDRLARCA